MNGQTDLTNVAHATDAVTFLLRNGEGWQEQRSEDGNNRDDDKQFNEGEGHFVREGPDSFHSHSLTHICASLQSDNLQSDRSAHDPTSTRKRMEDALHSADRAPRHSVQRLRRIVHLFRNHAASSETIMKGSP